MGQLVCFHPFGVFPRLRLRGDGSHEAYRQRMTREGTHRVLVAGMLLVRLGFYPL